MTKNGPLERKRLFHNLNGAISDEVKRPGLDLLLDGRGIGVAHFDNDGRLDRILASAYGEPLLYRNMMPPGPHWVEVLPERRRLHRASGRRADAHCSGWQVASEVRQPRRQFRPPIARL
jgi:hypothetical protein